MLMGSVVMLLSLDAIGCGSRFPEPAARPLGTTWYCGEGNYTACGRTQEECESENKRIGSRVVQPGPAPRPKECKSQPLAFCYTYTPGTGKKRGDCFESKRECEAMLKESHRAEGEHRDLSECGSWD
jgi:hypothetical protein